MNSSFLLEKDNKKYILYIPNSNKNKTVNRKLEKECQSTIYNLGLTSKNVYFNTLNGIKLNEFIEGSSLDKVNDIDYKKVASMLKNLHTSTTLASKNYMPFTRLNKYEKWMNKYQKEHSEYDELKTYLLSHMDELNNVDLVLSHNDMQRSNIVKDNNDNYYLIDFEFAANNDSLYDIAAFANNNLEDGEKLLKEYYQNPDRNIYKRFYLWRIFISLQWYTFAIKKHYENEGKESGYDFLLVADNFIKLAYKAKNKYEEL